MKKWKVALIFILLISLFYQSDTPKEVYASNSGDSPLVYEHLTINIMPQYVNPDEWESENPAVLIGIHGTVVNNSESIFKDEIEVPVPSKWETFSFANVGETEDGETIKDLEATIEEEARLIKFYPENEIQPNEKYNFVIEYYFELTQKTSPFEFHIDYDLERHAEVVNILIYEPHGAENFTLSAEADFLTEMFDIPVHTFIMGEREPGRVLDLSVTYEKDEPITTLEALASETQPAANNDSGGSTERAQTESNMEQIIMIAISILIIGLFLFLFIQSKRKKTRNKEIELQVEHSTIVRDELRQKLLRGEIDKETYEKESKKLTS